MLIETIGNHISGIIAARVKESKYYSIMFDETADASHREQLSFSVRYVHDDGKASPTQQTRKIDPM